MIAILPPHEVPGTKLSLCDRSTTMISGIKSDLEEFFKASKNLTVFEAEKLPLRKTMSGVILVSSLNANCVEYTRINLNELGK